MTSYKRFTLNDRIIIQRELSNKTSLSEIARLLGRHKSSISREIRNHLVYQKKGAVGYGYNACKHRFTCIRSKICSPCHSWRKYKKCKNCKLCNSFCTDFEKENCKSLEKAPYVCNGCGMLPNCTLEKRFYRADSANKEYRESLSEIRKGIPYTEKEIQSLDAFLSPLILRGQSPHHICITNRDEVMVSERTIYRLVNAGLITARNIDLPRKVRFKPRKNPVHFKVDRACRKDRTYEDFLRFMEEHPDLSVVELDSVEGEKGGKVLLTIHFVAAGFMLAFLRERNTSQSVIDIFNHLYEVLGHDIFIKLFPVCLADNGTEFSNPHAIEFSKDGQRRTHIFYCDPGRPYQKGAAERNHEFIREFVPKGNSFDDYEQREIQRMMDHINSYCRKSIGERSPYEVFAFMHGESVLKRLGCHLIPPKDVTLKPSVLRKEDKACDM